MIYRIYSTEIGGQPNAAMTIGQDPQVSFLFNPANTDYQQFKQSINDDTAQLEDADGNLMTAEDAKQFVSTLP